MGKSSGEQTPAFTRLETLTGVVVVGVLALALGLVGLAMPMLKTQTKSLAYTQSGTFDYSAHAGKSSPYGPEGLSAGEPILLGQTGPVTVGFHYKFTSDAPASLRGTAAMQATVKLSQGLTRQFAVTAQALFTGGHMTISGRFPLPAVMKYIHSAQSAFQDTGISTATVTLQPRVTIRGAIGGHPLKTSYSPKLDFTVNGTTLMVGQAAGVDPSAPGQAKPLEPTKKGKVSYKTSVPNTVPLLVVHPPVTLAREIGFGLAGLCLLLGLFLARPLLRSGKDNEPARIRTLYGAHLIEVSDLALKDGPVADVASMDSLADLAKKYESMIMHVRRGDGDAYLVWDNGMLYRYRPAPAETPVARPPQQPGTVMTKPKTKKLNGVARR